MTSTTSDYIASYEDDIHDVSPKLKDKWQQFETKRCFQCSRLVRGNNSSDYPERNLRLDAHFTSGIIS